jgi:hypothetical protein
LKKKNLIKKENWKYCVQRHKESEAGAFSFSSCQSTFLLFRVAQNLGWKKRKKQKDVTLLLQQL